MGYRSMNEVMNFLDRHDLDGAKACFHDEFMYLRELEMLTIDDMSEHFQEFIDEFGWRAIVNRVPIDQLSFENFVW